MAKICKVCLVVICMMMFAGCTLSTDGLKKGVESENSSTFLDILTINATSGYSNRQICLYNENNELLYEIQGNISYDIDDDTIEIKMLKEDGTNTKQVIGVGSNMYYIILEMENGSE